MLLTTCTLYSAFTSQVFCHTQVSFVQFGPTCSFPVVLKSLKYAKQCLLLHVYIKSIKKL